MSLLMALLTILVGANLISPINTAVSGIVTPTYSSSVSSLSGLLPLFFVVMIILYVFRGVESAA